MPDKAKEEAGHLSGEPGTPDDDFLIASMLAGDPVALRALMRRYDRLVRYTVFGLTRRRCLHDPQWLDSVASATWAGFVRTLRKRPEHRPTKLATYLIQIARNQSLSALRRLPREQRLIANGEESSTKADAAAWEEDPAEIAARTELIEAMRWCLSDLGEADRAIASQLVAITERRWREAAGALGMKESTLRSRWGRVLDRLRRCVRAKTGENLAPPATERDP